MFLLGVALMKFLIFLSLFFYQTLHADTVPQFEESSHLFSNHGFNLRIKAKNLDKALKSLKQGTDPNLYTGDIPLLHQAVFLRNPQAIKLLVEAGANVNFRYNNDITPLLLVVTPVDKSKENFEQYITELIKDSKNKFRNQKNLKLDKEITQALLDAGADINAKALNGNSLLINALIREHTELASFLIEKGANLEEAIKVMENHIKDLILGIMLSQKVENQFLTFILPKENVESPYKKALTLFEGAYRFLKDQLPQKNQPKSKSPQNNNNNNKPSCKGAFVKPL